MALIPRLATGTSSTGLDIGSSAIKLVKLHRSKDGISLHKAGSVPTPPESVKGGVIVDPLAVAKGIRSLLEALQVDASSVVAGIAGPTVVVREVPLPGEFPESKAALAPFPPVAISMPLKGEYLLGYSGVSYALSFGRAAFWRAGNF